MGPSPVLHVLVGPNGAGKSTLAGIIRRVTGLEWINADEIAADRYGEKAMVRSRDAARIAQHRRDQLMDQGVSFITETVASHPSKVGLVEDAVAAGYLVTVHVFMIPRSLPVARVAHRVAAGGHDVPTDRILNRYDRLWDNVVAMVGHATTVRFYDNAAAATPFVLVAEYHRGRPVIGPRWPVWVPQPVRGLPT